MTIELRAESEIEWPCPALDGAPAAVFIGPDSGLGGFEVLVATLNQTPTQPLLKEIYSSRLNRRSTDLIVVIEALGHAWLFGPDSDRAAIQLSSAAAQRALQATLDEADTLASYKRFLSILDAHGTTEIPGVKNKGLFASYHIRENVPHRKDWAQQGIDGERLSKLRHRELIEGLGFSVSNEVSNALILTTHANSNRAVAVLLNEEETFEGSSSRFPASPVSAGLSLAQHHSVPWLIVLRKEQIRLYPGRDGVGVGQKGQVETFFELDLATLDDAHLALLPLVFSADSLDIGGVTEQLLSESSSYAASLGARLRERVYEHVVPQISTAIALQLQSQNVALDSAGLQKAYSLTLRLLFRLLFQAYAEDRGLLPAGRNERYDANSLKTIAQRDKDTPIEMFSSAATIWNDLIQVWDAIDEGSPLWQVPAYNGGLFGSDPVAYPEGALLKQLRLPDSVLGPALQALLIDLTEDGVKGPVDFRSLSVREFGTIYEGLLESSLSLAESDLTVDSTGAWVPVTGDEKVEARAGNPYFHSSSGERKATGSYFTPKFVVDHLIQRSIDPTLDSHLDKIRSHIESGDQSAAARDFFDYRVADLAMGSGHFLVAAIDRIEARMRGFLAEPKTQVPGVIEELKRLRSAAIEALGRDEAAADEIEDASLLRRQIARRCIYGLDVNPLAVELARLAIWIHTFVPGLPMSSLDHGLVCANSLTGIGTVDEALDALDLQTSRALFARIFEYLDLRPTIVDAPDAREPSDAPGRAGRVDFENVTFSYPDAAPGARPTIDDVSFSVGAGEFVAFVGPSGSGKTTIGSLIARLYEASAGTVRYGGDDVRELKQESLMQRIGVVTQEPYLFHASIAENLRYAKPGATSEELEAAARHANIHDTVMSFEQGYDTVVGERGYRLSGGEKQRIAIARVLLKNPRVLVLDEATSALDTVNERAVQRALDEARSGRTTIAIAHRLSTVVDADRICVVSAGRIIEQGTHEELLALGATYAELYAQQG